MPVSVKPPVTGMMDIQGPVELKKGATCADLPIAAATNGVRLNQCIASHNILKEWAKGQ